VETDRLPLLRGSGAAETISEESAMRSFVLAGAMAVVAALAITPDLKGG
jgi:hypothetical protein